MVEEAHVGNSPGGSIDCIETCEEGVQFLPLLQFFSLLRLSGPHLVVWGGSFDVLCPQQDLDITTWSCMCAKILPQSLDPVHEGNVSSKHCNPLWNNLLPFWPTPPLRPG